MSSQSQDPHILSQAQASHLLGRAAKAIVAKAGGGQRKQEMAMRAAHAVAPKIARFAAGKVRQVVGFKMGGRVAGPARASGAVPRIAAPGRRKRRAKK